VSSPGTDPCHCSISRLAQLNYILTFREARQYVADPNVVVRGRFVL